MSTVNLKTISLLIASSLGWASIVPADVIATFKHGEGKHTVIERNPDGSRTWTTTDAKGIVSTKTVGRPGGYVEWTDDEGNDHTWTNTPDGKWTRTTMAPGGKKTVTTGDKLPKGSFVDGSGNRTEVIPQQDGSRLWITTHPDGKETFRTVGKPGGLVTWDDPQGNSHRWTSKPDGTWQRISVAPDGTRTVTNGRFKRGASSNQPAVGKAASATLPSTIANQPFKPLGPIVVSGMKLPTVPVKLSPAGSTRRIEEFKQQEEELKASRDELYRMINERQKQILNQLKTLRSPMPQVSKNRMQLIKEYGALTDYGRAVQKQSETQLDEIRKEIDRQRSTKGLAEPVDQTRHSEESSKNNLHIPGIRKPVQIVEAGWGTAGGNLP